MQPKHKNLFLNIDLKQISIPVKGSRLAALQNKVPEIYLDCTQAGGANYATLPPRCDSNIVITSVEAGSVILKATAKASGCKLRQLCLK